MPAGMMAGSASYFNPLPPCGGRQMAAMVWSPDSAISIHSLRVEGDAAEMPHPRLPLISIHSLRVEGDSKIAQLSA